MGNRFYEQQGLSVSDFQLGTFKNKPTKAVVVTEISRVLTFFHAKTVANTTTLANLLEIVEFLKSEKFQATGTIPTMTLSTKKQPYIDAIQNHCTFGDESLLKMFTVQGLRDFTRFINEQATNS